MKQFLYAFLVTILLFASCKEKKQLSKTEEDNRILVFSPNNTGQKYHLLSDEEKIRYLTDLVSKNYKNNAELDEWVLGKLVKEPEIFENTSTKTLKDLIFHLNNNSVSKSSNYLSKYIFEKKQLEKFKSLQAIAIKSLLDDLQPKSYKDSIKYYLDFY